MRADTGRRAAAVLAVLAGCVVVADCGAPMGGGPPRRPVSSVPASGRAGPSAATSARCQGLVRVGRGMAVPPWRLGAIGFLSPGLGLALTAAQIPCTPGPGQGTTFVPQQVRLAVSRDGGRQWATSGQVLANGGPEPGLEQVVAVSARQAWALTAGGRLLATRTGGAGWAVQPLPAPVLDIAAAGGMLWALACPRLPEGTCRPVLERAALSGSRWQRLPVPRLRSGFYKLLDAVSARAAVFLISGNGSPRAELASTGDAGQHWVLRPAARGPGHLCDIYTGITHAGPRQWWLICDGSGAGGSSPKALMTTTNAGHTWHTVATVRSILAAPKPGSLPYQEVLAIAAGAPGRLWVVTANGLADSTNGGVTWAAVPGVDPQGVPAQFDVLSPRTIWLLAAGSGLWGTSNGTTWHRVGPAWSWLP